MRFAEEMMLNSTRYSFTAYMYRDPGNDSRCALGLVNGDGDNYYDMNWSAKYPWLSHLVVEIPCSCFLSPASPIGVVIAHIFNEHVVQGKNTCGLHLTRETVESWSLEKLADWINLHDPTPPEVQVAAVAEQVAEPGYDREECEEIAHRAV